MPLYPFGFAPTFHHYRLDEPSKLKKPSTIFVGSMADMFGEWVPDSWIGKWYNAYHSGLDTNGADVCADNKVLTVKCIDGSVYELKIKEIK
jgi:hypothetical protein